MSKYFLLSALLASALTVSAADFTYGLCGDTFTGFGTYVAGCNYSAAIEVPAQVAASMKGSKVTEVSVGFHSGMAKGGTVYLTYDLEGTPFYEETIKPLKAGEYSSLSLSTPYEIEGKTFYIGFSYRASTATGTPIGFDNSHGVGNPTFSHLAVWTSQEDKKWINASEYGNLALRATISGDNLPAVGAVPMYINLPDAVTPSKEFTYTVGVCNLSTAPLNEIEVTQEIGGTNTEPVTITLDSPVAPGADGTITVTGSSNLDTMDLLVKTIFQKANGEENPWSVSPISATTICSSHVFPRIVVAEEFTGTTCGYCPRGIYSMEILKENFPDRFIPIEVHNYSPSDPMYCQSYNVWVNKFVSGAPNTVLCRKEVFGPEPGGIIGRYQTAAGFVKYRVGADVEYADDSHTSLAVKTYSTFGDDFPDNQFALSFVLLENNMGPYTQSNNYAGMDVEMGGWENKGSRVTWTYNDVARKIFDWTGRPGTIPASVKMGETTIYETVLPIEATEEAKHKDLEVVVLLLDQETGEILTATKAPIASLHPEHPGSGVSSVNADSNIRILSMGDCIIVEGDFSRADIFTTGGVHIGTLTSAGSLRVPAGLYVVRAQGATKAVTSKVMVR